MSEHIRLSTSYLESVEYKEKVDEIYRKAVSFLEGTKLYGFTVNPNNPKEIIACLYLMAQDFNLYHERF